MQNIYFYSNMFFLYRKCEKYTDKDYRKSIFFQVKKGVSYRIIIITLKEPSAYF